MPLEVELKSVVGDVEGARQRLEAAGARVTFAGRLEDRRYDTAEGRLVAADEVLRLRVSHDETGTRASLDWKGPTRQRSGYKVRDEITANTSSAVELARILERLGYRVIGEIDRAVTQYALGAASIRFERYPRMDALVEVEGAPEAIEQAIEALGLPRAGFSGERLATFIARFEQRTGLRAAVSTRQLTGTTREETLDA